MHIVPVFIPETHNQTNYKIFDQVMFFMYCFATFRKEVYEMLAHLG